MNRKASRFLAYPYIIWMAGFTVIRLLMVFYYGLTDRSGAFTLANILAIGSSEHLKALWLSLLLAGVSVYLYPSDVDELPFKNHGVADPA